MSDKPISVGDLVMVVKPKRCCAEAVGAVFNVLEVIPHGFYAGHSRWLCRNCGASGPFNGTASGSGFVSGYPKTKIAIYRLKRIDPDALKEETPTREELTA